MPDTLTSAAKTIEILTQRTIVEQEPELLPARNCLIIFSRAKNPLSGCDGFSQLGTGLGAVVGGAAAAEFPPAAIITAPAGGVAGGLLGCAIDYSYR